MEGAGKATRLVRLKARAKPSQCHMGYRARGRPPQLVGNTGSAEGSALERRAEDHLDPLPFQHVCRRLLEWRMRDDEGAPGNNRCILRKMHQLVNWPHARPH